MKKFLNSEKSWLLVLGIFSLLLGMLFYFLIGDEFVQGSRNFSDLDLSMVIFSAVLLAPILEELTFRGPFSKITWLRYTSLILIVGFILFEKPDVVRISILLVFLLSYLVNIKISNQLLQNTSILSNVLLFTVIHYKTVELTDASMAYFALFQFGLGAIFIWLIVNYGIIRSMLFHAGWNSLLMFFILFGLQYPDEKLNTFENSRILVEWKKSPRFKNKETFVQNINDDTLIGRHVDARFLYKVLNDFDKIDGTGNLRLLQTDGFMRYNFKAVLKPGTEVNLKQAMTDFLIKEKFIYFLDK